VKIGARASRARQQKSLTDHQLVLAWQSASLLLGYPDEELLARTGLLRKAATTLPAMVSDPLLAFLEHLENTPLPELAADFVATFDHRRRCCLYLTYFEHGDTRNRGVALLRFKTAYREAGMLLSDAELPDHLGVLLEFGATGDLATARTLLLEHRAGLELLRLALEDARSPWADVLRAVSATLPPLAGDDREAVMKLAAQGPPAEEVGLAPFAPPEALFPDRAPDQGGSSGGGGGGGGPVSLPLPTYQPSRAPQHSPAGSEAANGARS
jgi:nitrate reductase molybdenum cofactor assembly chaperone NarJ/NarW